MAFAYAKQTSRIVNVIDEKAFEITSGLNAQYIASISTFLMALLIEQLLSAGRTL